MAATRPLRRLRRLAAVMALALVGFWAAVDNFGSAAEQGCAQAGEADPSLSAAIDPEPTESVRRYHLTVTRSGRPVSGARVCLDVDMGAGMSMPGMVLVAQAQEVSPGTYDIDASFPMRGGWSGRVLVRERGREPASVPISFRVS